MLFPGEASGPRTRIELVRGRDGFPVVLGVGLFEVGDSSVPLTPQGPGMPLLGEHSRGRLTRPHLRGHRVGGTAWSTRFECAELAVNGDGLRVELADDVAGLGLRTEAESVPGGALRVRHTVTNRGADGYAVEGLEVVLPVQDHLVEVLDFTGRHERERNPQRHTIADGLWLRESRAGRTGHDSATMAVVGSPGFSTTYGEVVGVHVGWSGNSVLRIERDPATGTTIGGGELLLPGELALAGGESYTTPWVYFAAAADGLDGLAAMMHDYQRSLPAHPAHQPVTLNVWEAVYFDHDLARLEAIADRAARIGVERFVLDDGWFAGRRDDTAGLGDWKVDPEVWPDGLTPLVEHVQALGMELGLWFEPEMVNPDSDLYRAHPDWILSTGDRVPLLHRNQLVLDLSREEVRGYLFRQVSELLSTYPIAAVKWDHNRDLLDAGGGAVNGAPVVHRHTEGFYALLDDLRTAHPDVNWESCASGGGRIDLGVLERVQRVWTSDMTDALARQPIQRWTTQLVAPEYVGAHVSSPTSHSTGRTLSLDFRAATALFGSFGLEWDLTEASDDELTRLASWVDRYKRFRPLLHTGRVVRPESPEPTVLLHGVVAPDRSEALVAHVQLDEPSHNRGVHVRVPGLDPTGHYRPAWEGPVDEVELSMSPGPAPGGPTSGAALSGAVLADRGFWVPRHRPETVTVVHLTRSTDKPPKR